MSMLFTCEETAADLSDYLDGVLPLGRLLQVKVHLYRCPACRALLATLRAMPELMAQSGNASDAVPAEAREALRGALERLGDSRAPRPWPATPVPEAALELLSGNPDQPMRLLAAAHARVARERRPLAGSDRLPLEVREQLPPEAQWRWEDCGGGVRKAELLADAKGRRLLLMHSQPGTRIGMHRHLGSESILVLEGAMLDGGQVLTAGCWRHYGPDSTHAQRIPESGCWALVREEGRAVQPGPLAWLRHLRAAG